MTRFAYCQCRMRKVFGSVFRYFGWTNMAVIYDVDDTYSDTLGSTLKVGLRKGGYYPTTIPFFGSNGIRYKAILREASAKARGKVTSVSTARLALILRQVFFLFFLFFSIVSHFNMVFFSIVSYFNMVFFSIASSFNMVLFSMVSHFNMVFFSIVSSFNMVFFSIVSNFNILKTDSFRSRWINKEGS